MHISTKNMQAAATEASELLKALANPHRLMIICQLIERERSVGELADLLDLRDSTVSQHLALFDNRCSLHRADVAELLDTRPRARTVLKEAGIKSRPARHDGATHRNKSHTDRRTAEG